MDNKTLDEITEKAEGLRDLLPDVSLRGDGVLIAQDAGPLNGYDLLPLLFQAKKVAMEVAAVLRAEPRRRVGPRDSGDAGQE